MAPMSLSAAAGRKCSIRRSREIRARSGGRADALVANVRDPESIEAMMSAIWATGPLTGLVNNAGANFLAPTETLSPRGYEAIRVDRDGRLVLRRAGLRQALDRRTAFPA